jgi:Domain of unknown function (DUF4157)
MTPSPGPIHPHTAGSPSRVIQGFFPGGWPRIVQASPAAVSPIRPPLSAPVQARPAFPPAPIAPGRPATGSLQPSLHPGQPPRPILPTKVQSGAAQPATPLRPQMPQPMPPQRATPTAVQPHASGAFPLPGNFTLKPRGSGQPLPEPIQKKMEGFFNTSFADVRVHVGPEASSIGALAFTHGTDLYFAPGQYNPQSTQGQQLLGHELTHVVQQRTGRVRNPLGTGVAVVQDPALEAEAERMGLRAASATVPIQSKPAGTSLAGATLQPAGLRPNTVAANGAILPARGADDASVQRRTGLNPVVSRGVVSKNTSCVPVYGPHDGRCGATVIQRTVWEWRPTKGYWHALYTPVPEQPTPSPNYAGYPGERVSTGVTLWEWRPTKGYWHAVYTQVHEPPTPPPFYDGYPGQRKSTGVEGAFDVPMVPSAHADTPQKGIQAPTRDAHWKSATRNPLQATVFGLTIIPTNGEHSEQWLLRHLTGKWNENLDKDEQRKWMTRAKKVVETKKLEITLNAWPCCSQGDPDCHAALQKFASDNDITVVVTIEGDSGGYEAGHTEHPEWVANATKITYTKAGVTYS